MTAYVGAIRVRALPAWQELGAALADVDHQVPCKAAPDLWSTDTPSPEGIEYAERRCQLCPVLTQCRNYADLAGEKGAVWGGRYRPAKVGRPPINETTDQEGLFA